MARLADDLNLLSDREYRLVRALMTIADIAEGSGTVNSLPHIAKIANAALGPRPTNWADDVLAQIETIKAGS